MVIGDEAGGSEGTMIGRYRCAPPLSSFDPFLQRGPELLSGCVVEASGVERPVTIKRWPRAEWADWPDEVGGWPRRRDLDLLASKIDDAKILTRLNHPNVLRTLEVFVHDECPCVAVERFEASSLRERIGASPGAPLSIATIASILADIACGLAYAHDLVSHDGRPLGLVHRNVTPWSILVSATGEVKLADFEAAMLPPPDFLKPGFDFSSPELVAGARLDRRSDLFTLGLVLLATIARASIVSRLAASAVEQLSLLTSGRLPAPSSLRADVPPELDRVAARLLARDPADRYPDASAVELDLRALASGL